MADEITLTLPRDPDFGQVAHLVLGGLAVRLDLTYEHLEDMKIALDALLDGEDAAAGAVTVRMTAREGVLETVVGPFRRDVLDRISADAGSELGLRRVLDSTVDDVEVDGDDVRLTKRMSRG